MAKAYIVGNPRGKKKKKKRAPRAKPKANKRRRAPSARPKERRRKPNPLEAVITGAGLNPHRKRKNKMAAKKRRHHAGARSHNPRRRKGFFSNKRRHHNRRRNPLLPVEAKRLPGLLLGGAAGGVGAVWIPNLLFKSSDTGIFGYLLNAITAVLGAWALFYFKFADLALGWLIGGGVATVGRIIDDYTGKQIIQFSAPMSGMGQFYRQTGTALPTQTRTDLTDYQAQAALGPAPGSGVVTAGSPAMARKGMGWAQFRRRAA